MLNGPTLNQFYNKLRNYLDLPLFLKAIAVDSYNKLFGFVLDVKQSDELQLRLLGNKSTSENVIVIFPIRRQGIPPQVIITIPHKNLGIYHWFSN